MDIRTMDMYVRLCKGKTVNNAEEARRFGVDVRSIRRDIDDIRAFLDEHSLNLGDGRTIEYDRAKKGFVMEGAELLNLQESMSGGLGTGNQE
jgi:predicted DNA-binding transcriptional regulator YafY